MRRMIWTQNYYTMKIAIVHEMLIKLWWAEKVVENWTKLFPEAHIFTLMYDESKVWKLFPKNKIHPQVFASKTQKVYNFTKKQRLCLPFMAASIENFDFSTYDIVLISSSGFAHGAITKPEAKTIVYYHAPARYLWDWTNEFKKDNWVQKWIKWYFMNTLFLKLRQWDFIASQRHDISLSNSKTTQKRIQKYFRLSSEVLYPPIETARFAKKIETQVETPFKNYYVVLSALTEFKKIDIAVHAFKNISQANLVIIWEWDERNRLEELCERAPNIVFVWAKYADELVSLVQQSSGLIFPGEEDFWIVPIEMMAAGKPVFALKKWWLTETVIAGSTWDFFYKNDGSDFIENFIKFDLENIAWKYSEKNCRTQASKFDKSLFENRILGLVHW